MAISCCHLQHVAGIERAERALELGPLDRPRVEAVLEPGPAFADAYLLTKTNDWAHEQEWRLVDPKWTGLARFQPTALDAIILGTAIPPQDRADVLEWVRASGLAIEVQFPSR